MDEDTKMRYVHVTQYIHAATHPQLELCGPYNRQAERQHAYTHDVVVECVSPKQAIEDGTLGLLTVAGVVLQALTILKPDVRGKDAILESVWINLMGGCMDLD